MNSYLRLLKYVLPYWRRLLLLFVTVIFFASLSGVSLTLIHPFLKIVLYGDQGISGARTAVETPASGTQGIPLPKIIEKIKTGAQGWFEARIYAGDARARLFRFCVILVVLFFIKNIFGYLQTYLTVYLEQRVLFRIRNDAYGHLQILPLSFFEREKTGHIISRLTNDVSMLQGAVIGVAASVIRNGLMTLIGLFVVLAVSWKLSILTFTIVPVNLVLIDVIGRKLKKRSYRTQEGMAEMTAVLDESISGMRVVKAFNMGEYEKRRFAKYNFGYTLQYLKMKLWGAVTSPTSELLGTVSIVVILFYGGNLVLSGTITPENLVLFVGAMIWVVTPVKNLGKLNTSIQESLACADRVFAVMDVAPEPGESPAKTAKAHFDESIRFESVYFEYVPGRPVLRNISFSVQPGEVVALVGPSGAGKTTLVDLIPRFYDPISGRILIDGVDIGEFDLKSLRSLMGMVTQEVILFNDTVRNNIAYGLQDCPLEKIIEAARAANAHDFITTLSNGYDTVIGERGSQLSGGQRQRISIARAVLKNPQVLIFDEATSALDTESEILVQEAIDRLLKGRTTFVIAHRLSTVQSADRILVLEDGEIREIGTHSELINSNGVYKRLYDLQFGLVS
jgi:subfamily B ATP-binding cassette protein MsbA